MSDKEIEENLHPEGENQPAEDEPVKKARVSKRGRNTRNAAILLGLFAFVAVVLMLAGLVLYRTGYVDSYVKEEFVIAFDEMGITFDADSFRLTASPLVLILKNATFNNKKTGEKLFRADTLKFEMTVLDLYELKTERNVNVDATEVDGIEVWVKFDEKGKSNFEGIEILPPKKAIKFQYASTTLAVRDGLVHFGDMTRAISGDVRNAVFQMEPEDIKVPDENKRYKFDFTSTDSNFVYDKSKVDSISIRARGVADGKGAEISELKLTSAVGTSTLTGIVKDWKSPKYDLRVDSTIDLMKTSEVFPVGTALRGFGNFEGTVKGEGEKYKVEGEITSSNLAASNIRLKALKVNATVNGTNTIYNGHGKAVAELLTFEDFIIDYPQLSGNIRGTGTDFRWFGELRAAAARTSFGTLAGLYIADADAEYRDGKFGAGLRNFRAQNFRSAGVEVTTLDVASIDVESRNGVTDASIPTARAGKVTVEGSTLSGVTVKNTKVRNRDLQTDVSSADVRIDRIETKDARLKNVTAGSVVIRNRSGKTEATASNVRSESTDVDGTRIGNITAAGVDVTIAGRETKVYSNNIKVAKIDSGAAILGSLNIGGVRLSVRDGRIEGTTNDFDAGDISLRENGKLQNVKVRKPVFVLEPSGRYRASLDMSLGGGVLGRVTLGAARAAVVADNDRIELKNLTADVMDGKLEGSAAIATSERNRSQIKADFTGLELSKLLALQGGTVIPIEGKTSGRADLSFFGTNFRRSSGTLVGEIIANAGSQDDGLIPLAGRFGVNATNGLFNIDYANLNTAKSRLDADGRFDLSGEDSDLNVNVSSRDAGEIERIFRVLNLSESLSQQLDKYQAEFAGNMDFSGRLTGNITDPYIDGKANLDAIVMRGKDLGSLTTGIYVSPMAIELRDGILKERGGGRLTFNVTAPSFGTNNISVLANLDRVELGSLLTALAIQSLPDSLRDIRAETSGELKLTGLPNEMQGEANITAKDGSVKGQSFDNLESRILFQGTVVRIERFEAKFGNGILKAAGTYDTSVTAFDLKAEGSDVPISRIFAFFPENPNIPAIEGRIDLKAEAAGISSDSSSYNINFSGVGENVVINNSDFGNVTFDGKTVDRMLSANIATRFRGQTQLITGTVNFADPGMPLVARTVFNKTRLAPYIAIFRKPDPGGIGIDGEATGEVFLNGNLTKIDGQGNRVFTSEFLVGKAGFSQFDLQIDETPLNATEPIDIRFSMNEATIGAAKFAGGGTNLTVSGTKAFNDNGVNNLSLDGKINLRILNALSKNIFFSGFADIAMRLTGINKNSRLNGVASVESASASTFISSERVTFERLKGSVIFTTNQIQIQRLTGFLGGGKIVASGGAYLDGLVIDRYRIELNGQNITARLPQDFVTTGNADIQINARRINGELDTLVSGTFYAKRSVYSKDIDLADLISGRQETSLSQTGSGSSVIGIPKMDIRVLGRNALRIRNNIADLDASADLRVTGDVEFPQISGRITATSGTILFRNDRYEVQRGVLTFPPNSGGIEPLINLQAESQISGYQVFVNLNGKLTDAESLTAALRSNPSLPQADVVSLVTTGNLSNTGNGIPTYAQSGINTAAEILTDEIINKPIARATDRLFGINKFALDPIISGVRRNPTARLTVGRQINRNLLITYSTNLSEDQNQVLALEYRVSNRLSFVAQYEQRSLTNVTRNRNNFSFEIRLKKRF